MGETHRKDSKLKCTTASEGCEENNHEMKTTEKAARDGHIKREIK